MDAETPSLAGRLKPGTVRRIVHAAFVLVALFLAVHWARQALPHYLPKDWNAAHEGDSLEDWGAARLYLQNIDPYSDAGSSALHAREGFGHPPLAVLWVLPIAPLDKPIAAELMSLFACFLLAMHLYICAREIRFPAPIALSILLFAWVSTTPGFIMHWHLIQSSEPIAFALTVCWLYLRRGREWPAGIALAAASTLKLYPGVLYLFLLLARRFRAFAMASLAFGVAVAIASAKVGPRIWQHFWVRQKHMADLWVGHIRNESLPGVVIRLLSPVCVSSPVPNAKASLIATGISIVLLSIAAVASRRALRRARREDPRAIDLPFALFTALAVFVNPMTWEHYWVVLIQPAFVVANTLYGRFSDTLRDWLDETGSARALITAGLPSAVGVAGILAIVELLQMQNIQVERLFYDWAATKSEWSHHQMHLYEVLDTAPWVIMILLCFMTLPFATPATRAGAPSDLSA